MTKQFLKQVVPLAVVLFFSCNSFAQDYIWNKEHTCRIISYYPKSTTGTDSRTFTYTGDCKDGFLSGNCSVVFAFGVDDNRPLGPLTAKFIKGVASGIATFQEDTHRTEGNMKDGKFEGPGKVFMNWRSVYWNDISALTLEVNFFNNQPTGDVKFIFPNGDKFVGKIYKDNYTYLEGKGTYYFINGDKYVGEFKSMKSDKGIMYYKNGSILSGAFEISYNNFNEHIFTTLTGEKIRIDTRAGKQETTPALVSKMPVTVVTTPKQNQPSQVSNNSFSDKYEALRFLKSDEMRILASKKQNGYWINPYKIAVDEDYFSVEVQYTGKISEKDFMDDNISNNELNEQLTYDEDSEKEYEYDIAWEKIVDVKITKENGNNYKVTIYGPFEDENEKNIVNEFAFVAYNEAIARKYKDAVDIIAAGKKNYLSEVRSKFRSVDDARVFLARNFAQASALETVDVDMGTKKTFSYTMKMEYANGGLLIKQCPVAKSGLPGSCKALWVYWHDSKLFKLNTDKKKITWGFTHTEFNKEGFNGTYHNSYKTKSVQISADNFDAKNIMDIQNAFTYLDEFYRPTEKDKKDDENIREMFFAGVKNEINIVQKQKSLENEQALLASLKTEFASVSEARSYLQENFVKGYTLDKKYWFKITYSDKFFTIIFYDYNEKDNTYNPNNSFGNILSWQDIESSYVETYDPLLKAITGSTNTKFYFSITKKEGTWNNGTSKIISDKGRELLIYYDWGEDKKYQKISIALKYMAFFNK